MTQRPSAAPSERSRIRRTPHKAGYDRSLVHAIPDACPTAHVGYVRDGAPFVAPTLHCGVKAIRHRTSHARYGPGLSRSA